jgi:hypothetical protein
VSELPELFRLANQESVRNGQHERLLHALVRQSNDAALAFKNRRISQYQQLSYSTKSRLCPTLFLPYPLH